MFFLPSFLLYYTFPNRCSPLDLRHFAFTFIFKPFLWIMSSFILKIRPYRLILLFVSLPSKVCIFKLSPMFLFLMPPVLFFPYILLKNLISAAFSLFYLLWSKFLLFMLIRTCRHVFPLIWHFQIMSLTN
jgi:hypothetical protein